MLNDSLFSKTDTVVFIDSSVPNYKSLQNGVLEGVKTFVLSPNRDGIEEITEVLQQNSQITRLHIVSHGSPEYLYLGNTQLSLDNLQNYQSLTRTWNVESILLHNSNSSLNTRDSTSDRIAYVGLIGNPTSTNKINLSDRFVTTATPEAESAAFPEVNQTDTPSSKLALGNNVTEPEITSVQPNINEGVDVDLNRINNPPQQSIAPVSGALDLSQTFLLNSLAGANHTIYLDFNGHTTSGTQWNEQFHNGADIITPSFSLDNDPLFSPAELERIQYIWQRVAEDFSPFNVNVTTQAPTDINDLIKSDANDTRWGVRAVIGGSSLDWYGSAGTIGVAYSSSFNDYRDTPAFIFSESTDGEEILTTETISHEVGHTLGLEHDGTSQQPGNNYYEGQGSGDTGWAPIMGGGEAKNLSQWSNSEYANYAYYEGGNPEPVLIKEDELNVITTQNGFGYRTDDTGNTIATAKALDVSGTTLSGHGIIERRTDIDYYSFFTGAGAISLTVNPFTRGPNLDIQARLFDSLGTFIVSSNPTDFLFANIDTNVAAGTYYLEIDGVGKGDPLVNGYTDYGSLGQYTISGNIVANITPVITLTLSPGSVNEDGTTNLVYTFTRTESTTNALTVNYSVAGTATFNNDYSQIGAATFTDTTGTITFAANSATATLTIDPTADAIIESDETVALTLTSGTGYTVGTATAVTGTITNDDFSNQPPVGSPTATLSNIAEDTAIIINQTDLLAGFSDVDGDPLAVTNLTANNGTLVNNNNGTYTFTPNADFNGSVTLTYDVTDGTTSLTGQSNTFAVTSVNDAPVGSPTATLSNTPEDTAIIINQADLLAGFSDVDGDILT
ncbi:cadherin-like domain-containing protein, partial [Nodularia sp. LEGE 04288]